MACGISVTAGNEIGVVDPDCPGCSRNNFPILDGVAQDGTGGTPDTRVSLTRATMQSGTTLSLRVAATRRCHRIPARYRVDRLRKRAPREERRRNESLHDGSSGNPRSPSLGRHHHAQPKEHGEQRGCEAPARKHASCEQRGNQIDEHEEAVCETEPANDGPHGRLMTEPPRLKRGRNPRNAATAARTAVRVIRSSAVTHHGHVGFDTAVLWNESRGRADPWFRAAARDFDAGMPIVPIWADQSTGSIHCVSNGDCHPDERSQRHRGSDGDRQAK